MPTLPASLPLVLVSDDRGGRPPEEAGEPNLHLTCARDQQSRIVMVSPGESRVVLFRSNL